MDLGLLLEIATILSVVATIVWALAALGMFKSRRQREVEAALKQTLRYGSQSSRASANSLATSTSTGNRLEPPAPMPMPALAAAGTLVHPAAAAVLPGQSPDPLQPAPPRVKAFESAGPAGSVTGARSIARMQRRYRRTRCAVTHAPKLSCPRCGWPF